MKYTKKKKKKDTDVGGGPAGLNLPPQPHPFLPQLSSSSREHRKETGLGIKSAEGSQINSSYFWISRGGRDRKPSGTFSRKTADLQLASWDSSPPMSQRTLGCFSKNPLLPPALLI